LLYAGAHPSFVIDAYTKRVFLRHGWWTPVKIRPGASSQKGASRSEYEELQAVCESSLSHLAGADRMNYWGDYHAQLVKVGKNHCRSSAPKCDDCPLAPLLPSAGHAKTGAPIQSKI
jgi:endonuclease-3 related protein